MFNQPELIDKFLRRYFKRVVIALFFLGVFFSGVIAAFYYPHMISRTSILRNSTGWVLNCHQKLAGPDAAKPVATAFLNRTLVNKISGGLARAYRLSTDIKLVITDLDQANLYVVGFTTPSVLQGTLTYENGEVWVTECGRIVSFAYPLKDS